MKLAFHLTFLIVLATVSQSSAMEDSDPYCMDEEDDMEATQTEDDHKCTGEGEEWLPCGQYQNCGPVCGKLDEKCTIVHIQCPFGCQCPQGKAYIPGTRNCVDVGECDQFLNKACKKNMLWSDEANPCTDDCNRRLMRCTADFQPRCICDTEKGFAMNSKGKCVLEKDCD